MTNEVNESAPPPTSSEPAASADAQTYELDLSPTMKAVEAAVTLLLGIGMIAVGFIFEPFGPSAGNMGLWWIASTLVWAMGLAYLWLRFRTRKIVLTDETVQLPGPMLFGRKVHDVPLDDIQRLYEAKMWKMELVVLLSSDEQYTLQQSAFRDRATCAQFMSTLRGRLGALPGGQQVLANSRQDADRVHRWHTNNSPVTYAGVGLLAAVFAVEVVAAGGQNVLGLSTTSSLLLLDMGAWWAPSVAEGRWDRIFTSSLLHGGLIHLLLNSAGLFFFGQVLERYLGSWRFLVILLISSLGGTAATALINPPALMVGASGGVFGLAATLIYLQWTRHDQMIGLHRRISRFALPAWVGLDLLLSIWHPDLSFAVHAGGLVAGAAIAHLVVRAGRLVESASSKLLRGVALVLAAMFVAALTTSLWHFANTDQSTTRRARVRQLAQRSAGQPRSEWLVLRYVLSESRYLGQPAARRTLVGEVIEHTRITEEEAAKLEKAMRDDAAGVR